MRVSRILLQLALSLLTVAGASAASLDSARALYDSGELEAAGEELQALLDASEEETVRADALNLLGTIAVDRQDWSTAHDYWSRLLAAYPESAAAGEARTKLALVSALMDAQGQKPAETVAQVMPATAPGEEPEGSAAPVPDDSAAEAPASPSKPASPAPAASPATAAQEDTGLVLVAGRGTPYDAIADSTKRLIDWLKERGVKVESATTGVAVVQDSELVLAQLLEVVRERGAHSLLYLEARYNNAPERVKYYLYQPDGSLLWETKVRGGTGWTGEPYSKSKIDEKLFNRSLKKLGKMVGGPGLPVE